MKRIHIVAASALAALTALVPIEASADGVPIPAEDGEFYLTARAGKMEVERSDFRSQQTFIDNSGVPPLGVVSLTNPQGFLVNLQVDEKREWVPEIEFGFATAKSRLRRAGLVRYSIQVHGNKFKSSASAAELRPKTSGFIIDDGLGMGGTIDAGLVASYTAIDGSRKFGGLQGGFASDNRITDVAVEVEMISGGAEFMLHFDERWKGWEFSRGAGLTYDYQNEQVHYQFNMPELFTNDGNTLFTYDYDIKAHFIALKVGFSVARPLWEGLAVFANGSVAPGFALGDIDAVQSAPGQKGDFMSGVFVPRDTIPYRTHDIRFSYNTRLGGGLTWRLRKVRITGQGGIRHGRTHYEPDLSSGAQVGLDIGTSTGFWANIGVTIAM